MVDDKRTESGYERIKEHIASRIFLLILMCVGIVMTNRRK